MSKSSLSKDQKNFNNQMVTIFGIIIFLGGIFTTFIFADSLRSQASRDFQTQLDRQTSDTSTYMKSRIDSYSRLLLASAAIMNVKGTISREEWKRFYDSMRIESEFPSAVGVGYVTVLPKDQVGAYEDKIRSEGFPDFSVHPKDPDRDVWTSITYLEPFNEANQKAFGFDMFSEPTRRAAMEQARDTGYTAMSGPVPLVQDEGSSKNEPGILMYYPVYTDGTQPKTVEERRANIAGYTYAVLRPADVIGRYIAGLTADTSTVDITLLDTGQQAKTLYTHDGTPVPAHDQDVSQRQIETTGRTWLLSISAAEPFAHRALVPLAILGVGGMFSTLLAFSIVIGLTGRFRKVEQSYRHEVQKTKDELLALASHQLRTPASGVKQYVGMLAEGLVGTLTPLQKEIARKAYDANERQLHIINELLYVSKADAGQLLIEPTAMNLTPFVTRIVESFADQAAKKHITMNFAESKAYSVVADDRYVGMIIENLISNAIKYSYPDGVVDVTMGEDKTMCFVTVRDHGVGIHRRDFGRVFTKFDRIENPLSHTESGSGLGLFLAQQLAKGHGGEIKLVSAVGKGSAFTLYLPKQSDLKSVTVSLKSGKIRTEKKNHHD